VNQSRWKGDRSLSKNEPDHEPSSVHEAAGPVAALILAAGGSTRLGPGHSVVSKALLPWRGRTLLRNCVEAALASSCAEVRVVFGSTHGSTPEALLSEVEGLDVQVLQHDGWHQGMGSTLALASQRLSEQFRGAVVLLCDQPFVTAELIDQLIAKAARQGREIAACRYRDTVGAPAFFAGSALERLSALKGDRGAKAILLENPERVATLEFPLGAFDIDTDEDYDRALEELARSNSGSNQLEGTS
jgi:molybdenum cofactor cytidylyltransferase